MLGQKGAFVKVFYFLFRFANAFRGFWLVYDNFVALRLGLCVFLHVNQFKYVGLAKVYGLDIFFLLLYAKKANRRDMN